MLFGVHSVNCDYCDIWCCDYYRCTVFSFCDNHYLCFLYCVIIVVIAITYYCCYSDRVLLINGSYGCKTF